MASQSNANPRSAANPPKNVSQITPGSSKVAAVVVPFQGAPGAQAQHQVQAANSNVVSGSGERAASGANLTAEQAAAVLVNPVPGAQPIVIPFGSSLQQQFLPYLTTNARGGATDRASAPQNAADTTRQDAPVHTTTQAEATPLAPPPNIHQVSQVVVPTEAVAPSQGQQPRSKVFTMGQPAPAQTQADTPKSKAEKRKQNNRDAARRSRARKQEEVEELAYSVKTLERDKATLLNAVSSLYQTCTLLKQQNERIAAKFIPEKDRARNSKLPQGERVIFVPTYRTLGIEEFGFDAPAE